MPLFGEDVELGDKRHTRGVEVPSNPSKGDTWDELDTGGDWVMNWFWNGTYWLSVVEESGRFTSFGILLNPGSDHSMFTFPNGCDLFLTRYSIRFRWLGTTNDASNYRKFSFPLIPEVTTNSLNANAGECFMSSEIAMHFTRVQSSYNHAFSLGPALSVGNPSDVERFVQTLYWRRARP